MKRKATNTTRKKKNNESRWTRPNWEDNFFKDNLLSDGFGIIERDDWRKGLIRDLFEFFLEDENRLLIEEYCIARRIPRSTLYDWREKYEDLKKAMKDLLVILGTRRQLGMYRGTIDRIAGKQSLYRYDEECDRDEKRAIELAEKTQQKILRDNLMVHEDVKRELRKNGTDNKTDREMDRTDSTGTI